jgi:hypothetical protein
LYDGYACPVRTEERLDDWFQVETGVKQGCILSPLLFGIVIDFIMNKCCLGNTGIEWAGGSKPEDLDFADDIALICDNINSRQKNKKMMPCQLPKKLVWKSI